MSAVREVVVADLEEAVVEAVVRWYLQNGGSSGTMRLPPVFGERGAAFNPFTNRDRVGEILAECPHRVPACNPFNPDATMTVVERALAAEIAEQDTVSQLRGCPRELTAAGWEPTPLALELIADLATYHKIAVKYRNHVDFGRSITWLGAALGRVVHGDPARGIRSDPSFLISVTGP